MGKITELNLETKNGNKVRVFFSTKGDNHIIDMDSMTIEEFMEVHDDIIRIFDL